MHGLAEGHIEAYPRDHIGIGGAPLYTRTFVSTLEHNQI